MKPKLIVLDMDGTLLDSRHQLRPRTQQAIAAAQAANVIVTVATGRRLRVTTPLAAAAGISAPLIVNNGNGIYDTDRNDFLFRQPLAEDVAERAVRLARVHQLPAIWYSHRASGPDMFCERPSADPWFLQLEGRSADLLLVPDLLDAAPMPADKLVFHGTVAEIEQLAAAFAASLPGGWRTYDGVDADGNATLELFDATCSKADGVRRLAAALGIDLAAVMTLGDGSNDMEMLQLAGLGVAMGNAPDSVKAVADYVTATNDEDGAARAIEQFVLGTGR